MEDDTVVRNLVEILVKVNTEVKSTEVVLISPITKEFLQNINEVLFTKLIFTRKRWERFFNVFPDKMLSSPEMYLKYVIYACRQEASMYLKIFERFLSVFSLLIYITRETLKRTEVNFFKIVPDVFMVIYEKEMKESFHKCGGFHQFSKYVNNPKYLEMKSIRKYRTSYQGSNVSIPEVYSIPRSQFEKISREEKELPTNFNLEDGSKDLPSGFWAKKILQRKGIEFPSILNNAGLKAKLFEQEMAQLFEEKKIVEAEVKAMEESLGQSLVLNFDSEIYHLLRQVVDKTDGQMAWHENIIEAVIKYNHSKSSNHMNKKNTILKEVEKILEHLKETIMHLIEIVDKCEND
ncbi:hypothetical protein HNY73_019130 [Argiope bruennichi]|uniref:Uncharacterized protein n=1 Tax=Argiope bruennichi TaxID=94029 RepID=A0A8T0EIP2_ARGBR|nr:hypothetical protein HNY73_019130 [Argiope bruennichi]